MKVGIITASLPMPTRAALRKARELGAHGVQLWIVDNDLDPRYLSKSGRDELITYMAAIPLERSALCGDIGGFADPATVDERIARTKTMIDLCVDLFTPILTTHIGVVPKDARTYTGLLEAVREIGNYAAERGCCLATETGPEEPASLARFLEATASPGAMVNYDPANLCMNGFDHVRGVEELKAYIVHTHAKDGVYRSALEGGYREVALGKGDVDFPTYLTALRHAGFDGYLTIERECGDDPVADISEAVAFLRTLEGVDPL